MTEKQNQFRWKRIRREQQESGKLVAAGVTFKFRRGWKRGCGKLTEWRLARGKIHPQTCMQRKVDESGGATLPTPGVSHAFHLFLHEGYKAEFTCIKLTQEGAASCLLHLAAVGLSYFLENKVFSLTQALSEIGIVILQEMVRYGVNLYYIDP